MSNIPLASELIGQNVTEGQFKNKLKQLIENVERTYASLLEANNDISSIGLNVKIFVSDGEDAGFYYKKSLNDRLLTKHPSVYLNGNGKVSEAFSKKKLDGTINLSEYQKIELYPSSFYKAWVSADTFFSVLVPVKQGEKYSIQAGTGKSTVYPVTHINDAQIKSFWDNVDIEPIDLSKILDIEPNLTAVVDIESGVKYLLVSVQDGVINTAPKSIKKIGDSVVFKSDAVVDLNIGGYDKVLTAEAGRILNKKISDVSKFLESTDKIKNSFEVIGKQITTNRGYIIQNSVDFKDINKWIFTHEITLKKNDVLQFDYYSLRASVLWHKVSEFVGYPLLTTRVSDKNIVQAHEFKAYADMVVQLSGSVTGTIKVNGVTILETGLPRLRGWVRYLFEYSVEQPRFIGFKRTPILEMKKGDTVKVVNCGSGHIPILVESPITENEFVAAVGVAEDNLTGSVEWTADTDVKYVLVGPADSIFYHRKADDLSNNIAEILKDYTQDQDFDISKITVQMPELEYVFATHQNYILKTENIGGIEYIAISEDVGKTWNRIVNIIGDVVSYHFYSDGTIQLCSPTKSWWTDDYINFNEATLIDFDGSPFIPYTHHFFNQQNGDTTMFVGDTELYIWGEYSIGNNNPRVWYSTDLGRTVKCAIKFGATTMDGFIPKIRHVHDVAQDKDTEVFYLTTGDNTYDTYSENLFFSGTYDPVSDQFTWKKLGEGPSYKLGKLFFDKAYIYLITDYTADTGLSAENGIYRVSKRHVGDPTKYRNIFKVNPEEWGAVAPFRLVMDRHGNKVLLLDWIGQGKIWVATEGMDFKRVNIEPIRLLSYIIGPNYNGDVYCVSNFYPGDMTVNENLKLTGGTYNLTKALRNAGLKNFMTGNLLSNDIQHN